MMMEGLDLVTFYCKSTMEKTIPNNNKIESPNVHKQQRKKKEKKERERVEEEGTFYWKYSSFLGSHETEEIPRV